MTGFLLTAKQKLMLCINKRLYWCYRRYRCYWHEGRYRGYWADRQPWCHRADRADRIRWGRWS